MPYAIEISGANVMRSIENCMRRDSAKTSDLNLIASEFSHVHGAFGMSRTSVSSKVQNHYKPNGSKSKTGEQVANGLVYS